MYKLHFYLHNSTHTRGFININSLSFYVNIAKLVLELARKQEFYFAKSHGFRNNFQSAMGQCRDHSRKKFAAKIHVKKSFPLVSCNSSMCSQGLLYCIRSQGLLYCSCTSKWSCPGTAVCPEASSHGLC